jgi:hypothetical protein
MQKTKLTVIPGAATRSNAWLTLPETIQAPSPSDQNQLCTMRLGSADVLKMARAGRRQPIFEMWSMVIGEPPPVPGVGHRNKSEPGDLTNLAEAHACFQGIMRPLAADDDGDDMIAYVLKPRYFYENDPSLVSVALKVEVPKDLVFVVYVRLEDACGAEATGSITGTVTHWGFVEAGGVDFMLPVDSESRYRKRLW